MKKAKLIALAKTIISTSFPALRGLTLNLKIVETDDFVMAVSTGVLAHELCHAEEDCRHGPFLEALFSWLSERIPSLKTGMERRIDIAVIRKGYGTSCLPFSDTTTSITSRTIKPTV